MRRPLLLAGLVAACGAEKPAPGEPDAAPEDAWIVPPLRDAAPRADTGPPIDEAECDAACARLAECAAGDAAACPAIEPGEEDQVTEPCRAACAQGIEVAATLLSLDTCDAVLERAREVIPPVAVRCAEHGDVPECVDFGARLATCVVESCAAAKSFEDGVSAWLRESCVAYLEQGTAFPSDFGRATPEGVTCADPIVADLVFQVVGSAEMPSTATRLCLEGPALPSEMCAAACRHVHRCAAPDSGLGDFDLCHFYCALLDDLRESFRCAARNVGCDAMATCFN